MSNIVNELSHCPDCWHEINAPDVLGMIVSCPNCLEIFVVSWRHDDESGILVLETRFETIDGEPKPLDFEL